MLLDKNGKLTILKLKSSCLYTQFGVRSVVVTYIIMNVRSRNLLGLSYYPFNI